ncbi:hypothetical protein KUCAC02_025664 [Chaenocephalus aceratus]|uniref:Uncharacterized protein n=1 Tax=Chaenocephalus aceratus TaxID=36190 RepID=A0ACB9VUK5_CHAAC|nr:hypothetical protein KUCAC02_025664 [Chaenocephalus aceratus]
MLLYGQGAPGASSPRLDLPFCLPPTLLTPHASASQGVGVQGSEVRAKTKAGLCCPESQFHTMTMSMSISVGWWSNPVQPGLIAY